MVPLEVKFIDSEVQLESEVSFEVWMHQQLPKVLDLAGQEIRDVLCLIMPCDRIIKLQWRLYKDIILKEKHVELILEPFVEGMASSGDAPQKNANFVSVFKQESQ